jgi:ubiquinone/menaquinone biosynthesis C-methylase UbiE
MSDEQKNIQFYDSIAEKYDFLDKKELSNKVIREKVREQFLKSVMGSSVLDFGGGTGLDLEWLVKNFSKVYFCEPSERMREKAIQRNSKKIKNESVVFLNNNQADFKTWLSSNPFSAKIDAVLANFAVLNNIEEIETLFKSLSVILKPEGLVVVNILNPKPFKLYKQDFLKTIFSLLLRRIITIKNKQTESTQTIYLHSISSIKKAANTYFEIYNIKDLSGFGFIYLEFRKRKN